MKHLNTSAEIDLTCPHCGYEFSKQISWLQANPEFPCPGPDCTVLFKAEDFLKSFEEADREVDKFMSDMKKMFK